ncbi:CDCA2 protein, partial [Sitta europaea]|nr:CDCA2 protein [Sitta europaea]
SGPGSDAAPALSTRQAGAVLDGSLGALGGSQAPETPGAENIPSSDLCQSSSLLRSILKKTPGRELRDSPKVGSEYSNSATDRGGEESAAVSNCVKAFETLQTERTVSQSSRTPKKKVTFGEVLSPEIFDQSLPANTPLRRGASPGGPQGQSPWASPGPPGQPLPLLDLGWDEEGVEPLPEFLEGAVAAEAPAAVENAEVAETDKPDMETHSSTKRKQSRAGSQDTAGESSGATDTESDRDTKNPSRSKIQRQKKPTPAAPK